MAGHLHSLCCAVALAAGLLTPAVQAGEAQVAALTSPMKVGGLWCGVGLLHEFRLEIAQQFDSIEAWLVRKNRVRHITGHIEGDRLRADPQRNHTMELQALGNELRITAGTGVLALARGQTFKRAVGGSCSR